MQRLLSLKLLSKIPRNLSNATTNPSSQTSLSLISKANQCFSAPYTTFSHSWRSQNVKFSHGVFSRQLLANTHFRGDLSKVLVNRSVGLVRTQLGRRNFHSNFLVGSTRRSWYFTIPFKHHYSFSSPELLWNNKWSIEQTKTAIIRIIPIICCRRSSFGRFSTDGVVLCLILTNVAVFLLWRVADSRFMMTNFMISVDNFTSGRVHTLITSAFSHISTWHLISNMVGLYFFGTSIGRYFGPEFLLKLYLSGAVAGSVFYLVYHAFVVPSLQTQRRQVLSMHPSQTPGLGASGAVNAVMLLDIFLFPTKIIYFNFVIPVPAILLGIFIVGKDVVRILEGDTQVSGSAHLGGVAMAAFAWARVRRGRF